MVSREFRVQSVAVALAFSILLIAFWLAPDAPPWLVGILIGLYYGFAFGGANLYLYLRGDGDAIPRSARARFLVEMGILVPLLTGALVLDSGRVAGFDLPLFLRAAATAVFVAYFLNEARLGYADSRYDASR